MAHIIIQARQQVSKEDKATPVTGQQDGNGGNSYGTDSNTVIYDNKQSPPTPSIEWFGQLVAIVTGKSDRDP